MRKKRTGLLITAVLLLGVLLCTSFSALAVTDLEGHWAESTIAKWTQAGKIQGYEDGTFRPDNDVTRGEFATILSNLTAKRSGQEPEHQFADVASTDWYYDSVMRVLGLGLIPESEGFFPNEPITRQDAMTMAGKAFRVMSFDPAVLDPFADGNEISEDAKMYVAGFVEMDYVAGYEDNTLRPLAPITRAECIQLLDQLDLVHDKNSMKGILDRVYEGVSSSLPETGYQEITNENAEYFLGLKNLDNIDEALASDALMRPVVHSVCLVRAKEGADVEALKEEIRTSVNPYKWICTGLPREEIIVESRGNLILLIMDKSAPQEIADSFLALELESYR